MGQSGIQFLSTVILARLLTPDDYGIIGMVMIFITLGSMMVDSEMGGSLLRKENVTRTDYSTLFYYNLAVSIGLYVILFIFAPFVADFYDRPVLTDVIRVIGLTLLIYAFRVVQQVMIFRDCDFKTFAIISLSSGLLSLGIAIAMAYHGFGYWALVWQTIFSALFNVIFMSLRNRFLPNLSFSKKSFKEQFSFGISLLGSDTLKVIANNISLNIIAKFAPLKMTGNYTQYNRITSFSQNFFGALMNQSVFPILARIKDNSVLLNKFNRLYGLVLVVMFGISAAFVLFSDIIVQILLGKEWMTEIWMFQILSIAIIPVTIQILCRNVLKAAGSTGLVFKIESVKSVLVLGLLIASAMIGIEAIVWSVPTGQSLACIYCIYKTIRHFGISPLSALIKFIAISIPTYAMVVLFFIM